MTARITDIERGSDADASRYSVYAGPYYVDRWERATFSTAGQLWERMQDARLNGAVLERDQWLSMVIKRNELGTRRRGLTTEDPRGPRVCSAIVDCGRHLCFVGTRGPREARAWRVGAGRIYVEPSQRGFECGAL